VASGGSFRTIWCQHPYPTKALPIAPLLAKTRDPMFGKIEGSDSNNSSLDFL